MARLNRAEIETLRRTLNEWLAPKDAARTVEDTNRYLDSCDFFNQPGLEFLRDAWIGARLAAARGLSHIKLPQENDRWPDFFVRGGDVVQQFEAVEADNPDRRRGEEYRRGLGEIEHHSDEDERRLASNAGIWIRNAYEKKIRKNYGEHCHLVIYLAQSPVWLHPRYVQLDIQLAMRGAQQCFESVWIMWGGHLYQEHPRSGVLPIPDFETCI